MLKIPKISKWLQLSKALLPLKTTKKVTEGSPCCEDVRTVQLCPLLLCPTSALIKAKLQNIGGRLMGSEWWRSTLPEESLAAASNEGV